MTSSAPTTGTSATIVYAALAKLLRNGLVTVDGESGPDRKRYTITEAGVTDLRRRLAGARDAAGGERTGHLIEDRDGALRLIRGCRHGELPHQPGVALDDGAELVDQSDDHARLRALEPVRKR
jgi:DNA-binding PadR family transcriptional regulator